jgi:hypothetical protein
MTAKGGMLAQAQRHGDNGHLGQRPAPPTGRTGRLQGTRLAALGRPAVPPVARVTCSTSARCSASPGSWPCSKARSPSQPLELFAARHFGSQRHTPGRCRDVGSRASGAARLRWAFPPQEYGLANYLAMFEEDLKVIIDTVVIAVAATVMAVLIGFTLAWILTRRWCCSTSP